MDRRQLIKHAVLGTGAIVLLPSFTACSNNTARSNDPLSLPNAQPADWDAIAFNAKRALAGGAPKSYHGSISSAGGDKKHVGKHLPYLPTFKETPNGYIAVMFGDESKGHSRHPNSAAVAELDDAGHWYDWITIRKATDGSAESLTSNYGSWPMPNKEDNGRIAVFNGSDITANKGKETVYLAKLPNDVKKGDSIRITGHCKKHGDWTEFFTI